MRQLSHGSGAGHWPSSVSFRRWCTPLLEAGNTAVAAWSKRHCTRASGKGLLGSCGRSSTRWHSSHGKRRRQEGQARPSARTTEDKVSRSDRAADTTWSFEKRETQVGSLEGPTPTSLATFKVFDFKLCQNKKQLSSWTSATRWLEDYLRTGKRPVWQRGCGATSRRGSRTFRQWCRVCLARVPEGRKLRKKADDELHKDLFEKENK